jgi:hypothetical protein
MYEPWRQSLVIQRRCFSWSVWSVWYSGNVLHLYSNLDRGFPCFSAICPLYFLDGSCHRGYSPSPVSFQLNAILTSLYYTQYQVCTFMWNFPIFWGTFDRLHAILSVFVQLPSSTDSLSLNADHSGRAVWGMNCIRPLKHWGHVFKSHLRHGLLCSFILYLCCPVCM